MRQNSASQSLGAAEVPTAFTVYQNYPNPFNPTTSIRFDLPEKRQVRVEVFSLLGTRIRLLADGELEAGSHVVQWDAQGENGIGVATGLYICRVSAGDAVKSFKMTLVK